MVLGVEDTSPAPAFQEGAHVRAAAQHTKGETNTNAAPEGSVSLGLIYFDAVTLAPEVRQCLDREIKSILGEAEVEVLSAWYPEIPSSSPHHLLRVVLLDREPGSMGQSADVMGGIFKKKSAISALYLFYPSVLGNLRVNRKDAVGIKAELVGRALGRIVVHEIVHAVAPEVQHSLRGVMGRRLDRRSLTSPTMSLDRRTSEALRRGVMGRRLDGGGPPPLGHPGRTTRERRGTYGRCHQA